MSRHAMRDWKLQVAHHLDPVLVLLLYYSIVAVLEEQGIRGSMMANGQTGGPRQFQAKAHCCLVLLGWSSPIDHSSTSAGDEWTAHPRASRARPYPQSLVGSRAGLLRGISPIQKSWWLAKLPIIHRRRDC